MSSHVSIFNRVLSPIAPGPSSSNTCGVARLSLLCRSLFGLDAKLTKATMKVSTKGSFARSFYGMGSDQAFANGILGRSVEDPRFCCSWQDAAAAGIDLEVAFCDDMPSEPPELMRIEMQGADSRVFTVTGSSLGGGDVAVGEINGCSVNYSGEYDAIFFACPDRKCVREILGVLRSRYSCTIQLHDGESCPFLLAEFMSDAEKRANELSGVFPEANVRYIPSLYPAVCVQQDNLPFSNEAELLQYTEANSLTLWQAAVRYESMLTGWSSEQIVAYTAHLLDIIDASLRGCPQESTLVLRGIPLISSPAEFGFVPQGISEKGCFIALQIMQYANRRGLVVGMPTIGSAGVVPGVIYAATEALGLGREAMMKALLSAGITGMLMSRTHFFGTFGCQMEIGCAAGMAAASLTELFGGTPRQAINAAVLAMQCLTGLVCDTLAGQVVNPCIIRNMSAVSIAVTAANASLAGFDALIPLEETVDSMMRVGSCIHSCGMNNLGQRGGFTGKSIKTLMSCGE